MKTNDEKILELSKIVKDKKEQLKDYKKQALNTNGMFHLSIPFSDKVGLININTLTLEELTNAYVFVNILTEKAKELGENLHISGIESEKLLEDLKNKINDFKFKIRNQELHKLESKLGAMLSQEKKHELELDEIAELLK